MKKASAHKTSQKLHGVGASPGIAIGRALVLASQHEGISTSLGGFAEVGHEEDQTPAGGEPDPNEPIILVGHDFSPAEVLAMDRQLVLGFVNEMGGVTGHSAIVARTLAIPAVVGCLDICHEVVSGDLLVVDGNSGRVVINPEGWELAVYQDRKNQDEEYHRQLGLFSHLPAETKDGRQIAIEANLEMLEEVALALEYGATGVGLFRSEFYYLTPDGPPTEELLVAMYAHLITSLSPFPVTVRTLDLGGDKQLTGQHCRSEKNPALGLKAIRLSLREPQLFKSQLRALFRAAEHGNLRIMLPMITSCCELLAVKEVVAQVREELRSQGLFCGADVAIGMLVEVPSAVAVADALAKEVDFFSIGTNDLIQYALAVDRSNEQVAHIYNPLNPAVLRMIAQVVEAGHNAGIEVGLCGEMAGDVNSLPVLIGLGIDSLSMHPRAIPAIKKMVRKTVCQQAEKLAMDLLQYSSGVALQARLQEHLYTHYGAEMPRQSWLAGEEAE